MAFIPVPGGVMATVNQLYNGERVQNTLWFRYDGVITTFVCQSIAQGLRDYWISNMIPLQNNQTVLFSVEAVSQEVQNGPYGISVPGSPTAGTILAASQANNVTLSVSFRTGFTGRSNRGRNYWVGIPDTQISVNLIDTDYIADVVSAYFGLVGSGVIFDDAYWSVASRYFNGEARINGLLKDINAVEVVDNVADSMRRRLPGRGQ